MAFSQSSNYGSEPGTHDHPRHISARNRIVGTQPLEDSGRWGVAGAGSPWETRGLSCRAQKGAPPLQAGVALASLLFQIRLPRHNAGLTLACPGGGMGTATCRSEGASLTVGVGGATGTNSNETGAAERLEGESGDGLQSPGPHS